MGIHARTRCPILLVIGFLQLALLMFTGVAVASPLQMASQMTVCPYMSVKQTVSNGASALFKKVVSSPLFDAAKVLSFAPTFETTTLVSRGGQSEDIGSVHGIQLMRIGISHKDAAVGLREKLAHSDCKLNDLSTELCDTSHGLIKEAMVLSTCNRFEIYLATTNPSKAPQHVFDVLARRVSKGQVSVETLRSTMRVLSGDRAVSEHLFRVASGLDSIVLGEPQILGQVKNAWEIAKNVNQKGKAGKHLSKLFTTAFKTVGRIRSETALSRGSMSISSTAVGFSMGRLLHDTGIPLLMKARIVVIGNGKMARLLLQNLQLHNVKDVTVVCRKEEKVKELQPEVPQLTLHYQPMSALQNAIAHADVIFPCTSARDPIITPEMLREALKESNRVYNPLWKSSTASTTAGKRSSTVPGDDEEESRTQLRKQMQIVDISVPRNVHPDCVQVPGVVTYNVDDLKSIMAKNAEMRQKEVLEAERIVEEEVSSFSATSGGNRGKRPGKHSRTT